MRFIKTFLLLFLFTNAFGQSKYQKDFEFYWNTINDNFAYFDTQKTDWAKVKTIYKPIADTVTTRNSFVNFLETVNNELYNGHISLNTNLPNSNRLIPTGADLWVTYQQNKFIITAIREYFNADKNGLKTGMQITKFNDQPIEKAIQKYLPKSVGAYDGRMYEYAANLLLAGTHLEKRVISVLNKGLEKTYYPDNIPNKTETRYQNLLEQKILPANIGYVKINNSLGDNDLIKAFDAAMDSLWNTKGIILDLRETPSGGNTTVARSIMGRFIEKEMPYQRHTIPGEEKEFGVKRSWVEYVSPRGRIYKKPLVILVGRWTGSMGEGITIGFDGMKRAKIVGDKMAGLLGAIYSFQLPENNIGFSFPVEKLFHIYGTPREDFIPAYRETEYEECLAKGIKLLSKNK